MMANKSFFIAPQSLNDPFRSGDFFQKLPLRGIAMRALDLSRSRFVLASHIIERFREKFFICGLRLYRGMTTIEFENYAYKSKWTMHTFSAWVNSPVY